MKYLIDTNVAVDYFTGRFPTVIANFRSTTPQNVAISAVAVAELRVGADKSVRRKQNHERLDLFLEDVKTLDFDAAAAASYGTIRSKLERAGTSIGPNDMLIAAQALSAELILVTDNEIEFRKIAGLTVENWRT